MNIFEDLLSQPETSQVQPEVLEMLGHKAAQMFQKGIPLNQAVKDVIAKHPELGNEHIRRVVEFANNVTFQDLFQNSEDKNIHFDVADPGVVLRDLKDGGSPGHDGKPLSSGMSDYRAEPKESAFPDDAQQQFNDQFAVNAEGGVTGQEKNASVHHTLHTDPIDDVFDTHLKLRATKEKLAEAHESFSGVLEGAKGDFYRLVSQEILRPEGAGLSGVVGALDKVASRTVLAAVLLPITKRLSVELGPELLKTSMTKTAGRLVNLRHPLIQAWAGMQKAAQEVLRARTALDEVEEELTKTSGILRSAGKKSGAITSQLKKLVTGRGKRFSPGRPKA